MSQSSVAEASKWPGTCTALVLLTLLGAGLTACGDHNARLDRAPVSQLPASQSPAHVDTPTATDNPAATSALQPPTAATPVVVSPPVVLVGQPIVVTVYSPGSTAPPHAELFNFHTDLGPVALTSAGLDQYVGTATATQPGTLGVDVDVPGNQENSVAQTVQAYDRSGASFQVGGETARAATSPLADGLEVGVTIDIRRAGRYDAYADLVGTDGTHYGHGSYNGAKSLPAGSATIQVYFSTDELHHADLTGKQLHLAAVGLSASTYPYLQDYLVTTTQQFRVPPA